MNFVYWILFHQIKLSPRLNLIQFDKIEFSTFLPPENGHGLDFPHGRTKRPKIYLKENPCKENKRCWIVSLSCLYTDLFNQKLLKCVLFYSLLYKIENKLVFSEKTSFEGYFKFLYLKKKELKHTAHFNFIFYQTFL